MCLNLTSSNCILHDPNPSSGIPLNKVFQPNIDNQNPIILIVETDKELLAYLNKELKSEYYILRASNMVEAIDILNQYEIQLVLTEIRIPELEGILLCRQIKTDPLFSHIPVIFLTDPQGLEMRILGLKNGADAYIEKPISLEFLKAQVYNIILNRQKVKNYFTASQSLNIKTSIGKNTEDHFMDKLNAIIEDNISEIEITVDLLAKLMNVSRPTLYRRVNRYSNLKPNEMIRLAKLKKAAELLQQGKYTITQVASMVGYSVSSNFSRDFNKCFGMRPSIYSHNSSQGNNFILS